MTGGNSFGHCLKACSHCSRCAFVSHSVINNDCSWYAHCRLDDLRRPPKNAHDYASFMVRSSVPPPTALPPPPVGASARLAIAIATTIKPTERSACALLQWCERAELYARALRLNRGWSADVLLLEEPGAHGASSAGACSMRSVRRVALEPRLLKAITRCEQLTPATGDSHPARLKPILKFGVVALVRYDFVVYADSDVTLLPEADLAATAARWLSMGPPMIASGRAEGEGGRRGGEAGAARGGTSASSIPISTSSPPPPPSSSSLSSWPELIAHADSMSPVNGGLLIVRPSMSRYESGLRVLRRCRFNETHGWDLLGPPRALETAFRFADGAPVSEVGADIGDPPMRSDAYRRNDWRFVGADSDQGFLFHVYRRRRAFFRWRPNTHRAIHWRGEPKPWALAFDAHTHARTHEPTHAPTRAPAHPPTGAAAAGAAGRASQAAAGDDHHQAPRPPLTAHLHPWFVSRAYAYMHYSLTSLLGGGEANATRCERALWTFRRAVEDEPHFHALPDPGLVTMVPYVPVWR